MELQALWNVSVRYGADHLVHVVELVPETPLDRAGEVPHLVVEGDREPEVGADVLEEEHGRPGDEHRREHE